MSVLHFPYFQEGTDIEEGLLDVAEGCKLALAAAAAQFDSDVKWEDIPLRKLQVEAHFPKEAVFYFVPKAESLEVVRSVLQAVSDSRFAFLGVFTVQTPEHSEWLQAGAYDLQQMEDHIEPDWKKLSVLEKTKAFRTFEIFDLVEGDNALIAMQEIASHVIERRRSA
ncbi:MAG: hypothetical protein Q7R81_07270 [Candidatus Peregrinibacteria bacterium]|nr:hypothetical protein [Candidatus Peregrinibacteria bacterium]